MKLIIAGYHHINRYKAYGIIKNYMYTKFQIDEFPLKITEIVSGGCYGVDQAGEMWANEEYFYDNGHTYKEKIPIVRFDADWDKYGKSAGPRRNKLMSEYADCLLLIWTGKSKGSANMKRCMEKLGKPIYEIIVEE